MNMKYTFLFPFYRNQNRSLHCHPGPWPGFFYITFYFLFVWRLGIFSMPVVLCMGAAKPLYHFFKILCFSLFPTCQLNILLAAIVCILAASKLKSCSPGKCP